MEQFIRQYWFCGDSISISFMKFWLVKFVESFKRCFIEKIFAFWKNFGSFRKNLPFKIIIVHLRFNGPGNPYIIWGFHIQSEIVDELHHRYFIWTTTCPLPTQT